MKFLLRTVVTALALWASTILPGVYLGGGSSTAKKAGTLLVVAVIFGVVNAVLKPIIKVGGCLLYALSLGLFGLIVNGLLFLLTGWIATKLSLPFHVRGFWAGFWGAIIVAVVSFGIDLALRDRPEDRR